MFNTNPSPKILRTISRVYNARKMVSRVAKKPVSFDSGSVGSSRVKTILFRMITNSEQYSKKGFEIIANAVPLITSLIREMNFLKVKHGNLSL